MTYREIKFNALVTVISLKLSNNDPVQYLDWGPLSDNRYCKQLEVCAYISVV